MISIYDGNNYYRRLLETDATGRAPRSVLADTINIKHPIIWAWDGAKANERRRKIFDGYKRNRGPLKKDIYAGFETVQEVLKHTSAIQIKVPEYEADDVIATLTRQLVSQGEQVEIWSNDYDLYALAGEFPGKVFSGAAPKTAVPANIVAYYKVTVGDSSDRIPGIPGFGELSWEAADKDQLVAFVDAVRAGEPLPEVVMPKRCRKWVEENPDQLKAYWDIVSFFEVPDDLIAKHMTVGKPNLSAADAYLKEFFL